MTTAIASTPKIKFLKEPTSQAWIDQAIANIDTVLLDHSHCERKAAGMALKLMFQYPSYDRMVRSLTALAQEELEHFELCNQWLEKRGIKMAPLAAPPYGSRLNSQVRRHEPHRFLDCMLVSALIEARSHERLGLLADHLPDPELSKFYRGLMASEAAPPYGSRLNSQVRRHEPHRFLDCMLVSALIEARSHERLGLLADHLPDPELSKFYRGLMASEARHYGLYWTLAHHYCDEQQIVPRLEELAIVESEILTTLHPQPRVHS